MSTPCTATFTQDNELVMHIPQCLTSEKLGQNHNNDNFESFQILVVVVVVVAMIIIITITITKITIKKIIE